MNITKRRSFPTSWASSSRAPSASHHASSRSPGAALLKLTAIVRAAASPSARVTHILVKMSCSTGNQVRRFSSDSMS